MENENKSEQPKPAKSAKAEPKIQTEGVSTAKKVKWALLVLLGVLIVFFIVQNQEEVRLRILIWEVRTRLFLMMPLIFMVGMVAGYLLRKR